MCHFSEYKLAGVRVTGAAAWIDPSAIVIAVANNTLTATTELPNPLMHSPKSGRYVGGGTSADCFGWTSSNPSDTGNAVASGALSTVSCGTPRPIACCSSPYAETFRGFTNSSASGAQGGSEGMNAICHSEFPGSHLCHEAEYLRAASKQLAPASGAWLHPSAAAVWASAGYNYLFTYTGYADSGPYYFGNGNNCTDWTSTNPGNEAPVVTPTGFGFRLCSEAHQLACCGQ
jgi:hypothetical protein